MAGKEWHTTGPKKSRSVATWEEGTGLVGGLLYAQADQGEAVV